METKEKGRGRVLRRGQNKWGNKKGQSMVYS
jgi:hypothetical protein